MPLQPINNGEGGLPVRTALNSMLEELYAAILVPIKNPGVSGNISVPIPAGSVIMLILIQPVAGAPVIKVGTTGGGNEVLDTTNVIQTVPIPGPIPVDNATTYYFTLSGGTVNISILALTSVYE